LQNSRGCRAVQELKDAILKAFAEAHPEVAARAGLGDVVAARRM
jgi:pantoate kinase